MTHRSGFAAANRVAWRSQDAAFSGQVTTHSTVRVLPSQRRANLLAARAAAADRPRPIATMLTFLSIASSSTRSSSAWVASVSACASALWCAIVTGSRGDMVISASLRC
jgi:hypothetical protein